VRRSRILGELLIRHRLLGVAGQESPSIRVKVTVPYGGTNVAEELEVVVHVVDLQQRLPDHFVHIQKVVDVGPRVLRTSSTLAGRN